MYTLHIPPTRLWDEEKEEFTYTKEYTIVLEHSLVSISKWEAKWHKPYLNERTVKTPEMRLDYIKCMTITKNVPDEAYLYLTEQNVKDIQNYMNEPMTATVISKDPNAKKGSKRFITAELVYCWMFMLQIPTQFEKWHINRLLTLIKVCQIENTPPKKRSKAENMKRHKAINAARRRG